MRQVMRRQEACKSCWAGRWGGWVKARLLDVVGVGAGKAGGRLAGSAHTASTHARSCDNNSGGGRANPKPGSRCQPPSHDCPMLRAATAPPMHARARPSTRTRTRTCTRPSTRTRTFSNSVAMSYSAYTQPPEKMALLCDSVTLPEAWRQASGVCHEGGSGGAIAAGQQHSMCPPTRTTTLPTITLLHVRAHTQACTHNAYTHACMHACTSTRARMHAHMHARTHAQTRMP